MPSSDLRCGFSAYLRGHLRTDGDICPDRGSTGRISGNSPAPWHVLVSTVIRKATLADFDQIYTICKRMYPGRPIHMAIPWGLDCLRRQDRLMLISDHGFGVASYVLKYGFDPIGIADILAVVPEAPKMEAVRFLRTMIAWAKANGAKRFSLNGSDSSVDLSPLFRRVGGKPNDPPYYHVPLG